MKITLKKLFFVSTSEVARKDGLGTVPATSGVEKWQFIEQPTVFLCKEVERVLGLRGDTPLGTVIELEISKFCVIPPQGGC
jgi:hypothetical protein